MWLEEESVFTWGSFSIIWFDFLKPTVWWERESVWWKGEFECDLIWFDFLKLKGPKRLGLNKV